MLKQLEGSRAVAEAVAMCRPEVTCAYPITPQTHIVEALGAMASLDTGLVDRELARMRTTRRSGPSPENMLRDLGITASRIG